MKGVFGVKMGLEGGWRGGRGEDFLVANVPGRGVSHSQRLAQRTALRRHWSLIHYCPRSCGPSCGLGQGTALGLHWSPIHYRARFDSPTGYQQKSRPYGWRTGRGVSSRLRPRSGHGSRAPLEPDSLPCPVRPPYRVPTKKPPVWVACWYPVGESNPCYRRERAVS